MNCPPHAEAWMRDSTYYRDNDGSGAIDVLDKHVPEAVIRGWALPLPVAPTIIYAERVLPSAQALPLTNGVGLNVLQVTLSQGQWDIQGEVWFNITNGTPSIGQLAASTTDQSATIPSDPAANRGICLMEINQTRSSGSSVGFVLPVSGIFVSVPDGTTIDYYMVALATWTGGGALSAYGSMTGRMTPNQAA